MMRGLVRKIGWILLAGWVVFIYGGYLRRGIDVWVRVGEVFFRIFLLLLFILVAAGLGRKILKRLRFGASFPLEFSLFALAIGLGVFTYLLIGFGLIGIFSSWAVNLMIGGMFFFTYREIREVVQETKTKFQSLIVSKMSLLETALILVLFIQLVFNLVGALVLPSSWDGLGQHLAIAKEWVRHQRLDWVPYIDIGRHLEPFNIPVLYGMALLVKDAILAKLIHFAFGVLTAVAVYTLGRRYLSHQMGLLAGTIFYTVPIVGWESTTALVDLGFAFYAILAVYALINWVVSGRRGWLVISAVMSGLSLGSHNAGFVPLAILSLGILLSGWPFNRGKLVMAFKGLILFVAGAGLIGCFWYLRHFIFTGESIFGFLYTFFWSFKHLFRQLFSVITGTPALASSFRLRPLAPYLLLPWNITVYPGKFHGLGAIGFSFLIFLPFLVFTRIWENRSLRFILYYSGVYFVFWAVFAADKHYLVPLLPLFSILTAYVVGEFSRSGRVLKGGLFTLLILTFVFQMIYQAPEGLDKVHQRFLVFAGLKSQEDYILENEETYPVYNWINENLPSQAKIFVVNDLRAFYCDRSYVTAIIEGKKSLNYSSLQNGLELLAKFKQAHITHVVINQYRWDIRFGKDRWPRLMEELKKEHLQILCHRYPFRVFKVIY